MGFSQSDSLTQQFIETNDEKGLHKSLISKILQSMFLNPNLRTKP